jgi:hypothetical protein
MSEFLSLDEIRSEPVMELPDREMLDLIRVTLTTGEINVVRVDHIYVSNFLNGWCLSAAVAQCQIL